MTTLGRNLDFRAGTRDVFCDRGDLSQSLEALRLEIETSRSLNAELDALLEERRLQSGGWNVDAQD